MKIHQASKLIEDLFDQSENKSEKKNFKKLLGILTHLEGRDLTEEQLRSIEEKIDELKLREHPQITARDLKRKSARFQEFLRGKLSLIPEGYYTALGMSFGVALGVSLGNFIPGMSEISSGKNSCATKFPSKSWAYRYSFP